MTTDRNDQNLELDDPMTLDPPGRIGVIGAGLNGIEAALYGRFLGYDVVLLEAAEPGGKIRSMAGESLPVLPDRTASAIAYGALQAQRGEPKTIFPTTPEAWLDDVVLPLLDTDLLRGRLQCPFRVKHIALTAADDLTDETSNVEDESSDEEVPPDFRLIGEAEEDTETAMDVEAVIVATGDHPSISTEFEQPLPYFFAIEPAEFDTDWESCMRSAQQQIVRIYASLAGRSSLDLYRPRRI